MKSIILYEKYKNTKNYLILFCIFQLYLIENKLRTIAQIDIGKSQTKYSIAKMYAFLEENNIPYSKNYFGILISDKKMDLHLQEDDFIGLSKELGVFYKCSSNTYSNNHYRVIIQAGINNFHYDIFAQMCKKDTLEKM